MDDTKDDSPAWSPPARDPVTGVAMHGEYPLNHRLRAEALASKGETTDPDGLITDELIAGTVERLKVEDRAQKAAAPKRLGSMTLAELVELAREEVVPHEPDATRATLIDAITKARAERDAITSAEG